jgi:ferredoxin
VKVNVDATLCMGHGMCAARAPEVYRINDVGFNDMGEFEVPPELEDAAKRGSLACPEQIITIIG